MRKQLINSPLFAVLVLGVAILGLFLLLTSKPQPPIVEETERVWPVQISAVTYDEHRPQLTLLGHVESPRISQMTAAVDADVVHAFVDEGRRVGEGQLLVELDAAETLMALTLHEAEVDGMEAQIQIQNNAHQATLQAIQNEKKLFELNKAGVQREQKLFTKKLGSASRLDESQIALEQQALSLNTRQLELTNHAAKLKQLQADLKRAKSQLERAQLDLRRTRVVAPFAGRILSLHVSAGERVSPGSPIIDIYAADRLEIRALIPERYLTAVILGMQTTAKVKAWAIYLDAVLQLSLDRFAGEVDQARGGTDAIFTIAGEASDLPLGKALQITLDLPPIPDTLGLPMQAIFSDNRVYKVVNDRLEVVTVKKLGEGLGPDGAVMVIAQSEGLKPGDRYITTQLPNPVTGLKVNVLIDAPPAPALELELPR